MHHRIAVLTVLLCLVFTGAAEAKSTRFPYKRPDAVKAFRAMYPAVTYTTWENVLGESAPRIGLRITTKVSPAHECIRTTMPGYGGPAVACKVTRTWRLTDRRYRGQPDWVLAMTAYYGNWNGQAMPVYSGAGPFTSDAPTPASWPEFGMD